MHAVEFSSVPVSRNRIEPITIENAAALKLELPGWAIDGALGASSRVPEGDGVKILVGVGAGLNTASEARDFGAAVARLTLDDDFDIDLSLTSELTEALVEGLLLGGYRFQNYRSTKKTGRRLNVITNHNVVQQLALARRVNQVRDLINTPANDLWPQKFAELATELAAGSQVQLEVWDESRLESEGCGGILAVGRGSVRPPRLLKLSYGDQGEHFALIGKGITFDTGGLSIKPAEGMVGMKYDMAGAATALGAVLAAADLGLKVRIDAYLCLAENMPSGSATRPGDVITARNGKTIEVLNTDAEGRLVMADGLSLASETNPDHIIDIATLTGAATIALGNRYAGLMGGGAVVGRILAAADAAGELLWHMPLPEELRKLLDSEIADIANVKIGNRAGGMLIAGQFLSEFVNHESGSWAHLDIAGPANNSGAAYSVNPVGATGVMLRTLVNLFRPI